MKNRPRSASIVVLLAFIAVACAPGSGAVSRSAQQGDVAAPAAASTPKRLLVAAPANPLAFYERVARAVAQGPYRGGVDIEWLLNSALTVVDNQGVLRGQIAEDAPTIENGLWKLNSDGTMQTTWHIRKGAQWHDGEPFTSDDLVFTATLVRDHEVAAFRDATFDLIDSVEALDPQTVVVNWKSPLVTADSMFGHVLATPIPKHIVEKTYLEDKSKLLQSPYWLTEYVGTGPFRLGDYNQGTRIMLEANDHYMLGRPKIDEIEINIITDPATTMSNVLAGTVELSTGYGVSLESALELKERWKDGTVQMAPDAWIMGFGQLMNPNPAAMTDIRFRRALYQAINRQEMVDTLQAGLAQTADEFLNPAEPDFKDISSSIVHYDYDVQRSAQLLEELGFTRGADGFYRDPTGQRLSVEIRTSEGLDIQVKTTFAIADSWQRIGVGTEPLVSPVEKSQDREWAATFPGYRVQRSPNTFEEMKRYRITQIPTPENQFVGQNAPRYSSQTLTDNIDRYFVTVPKTERNQVLGQIVHEFTDQLVLMGMFYNVLAVVTGKRVKNVTPAAVMGSNQTWNAHLWELSE